MPTDSSPPTKEASCVILRHAKGNRGKYFPCECNLFALEGEIPRDLTIGHFWFVSEIDRKPVILRAVDFVQHESGPPADRVKETLRLPLVAIRYQKRTVAAFTLEVEELGVPAATGMSAKEIAKHFNWTLVDFLGTSHSAKIPC